MCTAVKFNDRFLFRTFDYERKFGEKLLIVPRESTELLESKNRYAVMGIGINDVGAPLFFDGVNEWGLCAAALNFPKYASYCGEGKTQIPSSKLITFILGLCRSVTEVKEMLEKVSISGEITAGGIPPAPLHWIVSDMRESIVIEPLECGLCVRDNPAEILTNSPSLDYHLTRLADFSHLNAQNPEGSEHYSRGAGAYGLPGDFSSSSRFIRAAFLKQNGVVSAETSRAVIDIFKLASSLCLPDGCVKNDKGESVKTEYAAIIDMESPAYYLTTPACCSVRYAPFTGEMFDAPEIVEKEIYHTEREKFSQL